MKMITSKRLLVAASLVGACTAAWAQTYPTKMIRVVVPYAAGGPTDIVARLISQSMGDAWKQPVVVENRPGAGGMIGTEYVSKASADGYTLLISGSGPVVVNQSLFKKMSYDTVKDLAPITALVSSPTVLIVPPSLGVNSVSELIALAKAKPGQLNYASAGNGTPPHLAGELLKSMAGVDIVHVPYSAQQATNAVLSSQVAMLFETPAALSFARAGKVKAIAVSTAKRFAGAPELPTVAEAGLPGFEVTAWYGLLAPTGTPGEVIKRIYAEAQRILALPEVKNRMLTLGFEPVGNTPEQFGAFIHTEIAKWAKVIRESGVKPE